MGAQNKNDTDLPRMGRINMISLIVQCDWAPYDAKHLPKFDFKFIDNETAIKFRVTSKYEDEESQDIKKNKIEKDKKNKKVFLFKYVLGSNKLTLISN